MNGQLCFRVNLSRPLVRLATPAFEILAHYRTQPPSISLEKMTTGKKILQVLIFLWVGIDVTLWFALITTIDFGFSENSLSFRFVQIFNNWCFSYGNYETQTQKPLISIRKPNCFNHKDLYGQDGYDSL